MKGLHKDHRNIGHFEPKEGQRRSLCSNKTDARCPSLGIKGQKFSKETLDSLAELVRVLQDMHISLVSKGWIIRGKEFIPPPGYDEKSKYPRPRT